MPRLGGIFSSSASSARSSQQSLPALEEPQQLEDAMNATMYILDDDMDKAESLLNMHNSAFHKLGKATVAFMRAVLGQEHDIMKEASDLIAEAEAATSAEQRRAKVDTKSYHSAIYAPGAEYSLCLAEAQVQSAIVGVLSESVTEAIKGFYKVRKAYMAMESIVESERRYLNRRSTLSSTGNRSGLKNEASFENYENGKPVSGEDPSHPEAENSDSDDDEFFEVDENNLSKVMSSTYLGNIETNGQLKNTDNLSGVSERASKSPSLADDSSEAPTLPPRPSTQTSSASLTENDLVHPIDIFIHSGVSLYFGMLQLLLSLVPPTFSKLLAIVGFRGDRARGLDMMWQATAYDNVNGAVASLVILGFYSGLVSSLDILPTSGANAIPWERCQVLVKKMRLRHPNSQLILMQDIRMMTSERHLSRAVDILKAAPPSKLKQIEALQSFENALNCMYLHRFQACADSFLHCFDLNNWSKALYTYIAGCAHVELYRLYKYGSRFTTSNSTSEKTTSPLNVKADATKAAKHAKKARELLNAAVGHTGKKRIFARQLPFDVFVARKVGKWTARATARDVELVDAVGVSPIEEMIFFWGGYGRMSQTELEESLQRLAWSDGTDNAFWKFESLDEIAALWVLRSTVYRQLGKISQAKMLLRDEVINKSRWEDFKALKNGDTWPAPIARYELAVCYWLESEEGRKSGLVSGATVAASGDNGGVRRDEPGKVVDAASNKEALQQCSYWLEQVAKWDAYDLDVRFGTRISTGKETLEKLGVKASV